MDVDLTTGAYLIEESNRMLIGTSIENTNLPSTVKNPLYQTVVKTNPWEAYFKEGLIKGLNSPEILTPSSISKFLVVDGVTPEIIVTNGACAIFSPDKLDGWPCTAGERLTFEFHQYSDEKIQGQTVLIGFIKDGIMYDGEVFSSAEGSYELNIKENGNYQVYLISASSDYVAYHKGSISVHSINK